MIKRIAAEGSVKTSGKGRALRIDDTLIVDRHRRRDLGNADSRLHIRELRTHGVEDTRIKRVGLRVLAQGRGDPTDETRLVPNRRHLMHVVAHGAKKNAALLRIGGTLGNIIAERHALRDPLFLDPLRRIRINQAQIHVLTFQRLLRLVDDARSFGLHEPRVLVGRKAKTTELGFNIQRDIAVLLIGMYDGRLVPRAVVLAGREMEQRRIAVDGDHRRPQGGNDLSVLSRDGTVIAECGHSAISRLLPLGSLKADFLGTGNGTIGEGRPTRSNELLHAIDNRSAKGADGSTAFELESQARLVLTSFFLQVLRTVVLNPNGRRRMTRGADVLYRITVVRGTPLSPAAEAADQRSAGSRIIGWKTRLRNVATRKVVGEPTGPNTIGLLATRALFRRLLGVGTTGARRSCSSLDTEPPATLRLKPGTSTITNSNRRREASRGHYEPPGKETRERKPDPAGRVTKTPAEQGNANRDRRRDAAGT